MTDRALELLLVVSHAGAIVCGIIVVERVYNSIVRRFE